MARIRPSNSKLIEDKSILNSEEPNLLPTQRNLIHVTVLLANVDQPDRNPLW